MTVPYANTHTLTTEPRKLARRHGKQSGQEQQQVSPSIRQKHDKSINLFSPFLPLITSEYTASGRKHDTATRLGVRLSEEPKAKTVRCQ